MRPPARPRPRPTPARASADRPDVAPLLATARAARGPGDRARVQPSVDALASLARVGATAYAGGVWRTVYTSSTGASAGRVGPLTGEVTQTFEAGARAYVNTVSWPSSSFPLLRARLTGTYAPRDGRKDRVDVVFEGTEIFVAGVRAASRVFPPNSPSSRGHWRLLYEDESVRVFETNQGNLFVLEREAGGAGE